MDNKTPNNAAIFPALMVRAEKAARWLSENPQEVVSHIDDFSGFFVLKNGKQKKADAVLHEFTLEGTDYVLVTRE